MPAPGLNSKQLEELETAIQKCDHSRVQPCRILPSRFTPGIQTSFLTKGKIYGAQIVGLEGVDKRIDVIATAIRGGMTVFELEELELAYAPPYGSARDPINIIGFLAGNMLRGDLETIDWDTSRFIGPIKIRIPGCA